MKILKRISLGFLALIALLAIWIAANSIDDRELSEQAKEMLKPVAEVPAEENGYNDIAYLNGDFNKVTGLDNQLISDLYYGKVKDDKKLEEVVSDYGCNKILIDIQNSLQKPHFMFPPAYSMLDPEFEYGNLMRAWELLILKARYQLNHSDTDGAIDSLDLALKSTEKIRSEEQHFLVSYFVGIVGESKVLNEVHALISNQQLSTQQFSKLNEILTHLPSINDEGLKLGFRYEFHSHATLLSEKNAPEFQTRLNFSKEYTAQMRVWEDYSHRQPLDEKIVDLYNYTNALLPHYYIHPNKTLNHLAIDFKKAETDAAGACKAGYSTYSPANDLHYLTFPSLVDLFNPNGLELKFHSETMDLADYGTRRCLFLTYAASIKTVVAIHQYQSEHNKFPESLDQLVPQYLDKVPLDAFDGQPLRYSAKNKWVYSVGDDYQDDLGSANSYYRGGCHGAFGKNTHEDMALCKNNPTVPIDWNDYPAEMR